jgi:hypothetical protein
MRIKVKNNIEELSHKDPMLQWSMFLILLLTILSAFAQEGYPKPFVVIETNVKNHFCFPVVINVNNKILSLEKNTSTPLGDTKWGEWHWLPGSLSTISKKEVFYPLKDKPHINFGPHSKAHPDKFAYDFEAKEGTPVFAMEAGIVSRIIQNFNRAHNDPNKDEANLIEVVHADGTVARYYHLQKDSVRVLLCQLIKAQDIIANSGNTGFSSGPHLHVEIFKPLDGKKFETLPISFSSQTEQRPR